jgi:hypothetical protein
LKVEEREGGEGEIGGKRERERTGNALNALLYTNLAM